MVNEKLSPQPYAYEELLSFDRLKRAVMSRVVDQAESVMGEEFPLSPDRVTNIIGDEWQRAKEAVRSSPAAREAFRKHLEEAINDKIDDLMKADREELGSLGVAEKSI